MSGALCMWPLSHRDKRHETGRTCGCACWLPKGHDHRHRCDQELTPRFDAQVARDAAAETAYPTDRGGHEGHGR